MCGVPVHSAEGYLERLIKQGLQGRDLRADRGSGRGQAPGRQGAGRARRGARGDAGHLTEDSLLDARAHNFLAALAQSQNALALAWLDVSTGDFLTGPVADGTLAAELARIAPGELLAPEGLLEDAWPRCGRNGASA